MNDYEMWHAIHDHGDEECAGCRIVDIDLPDEEYARLVEAAEICGESVDVFIHKAIRLGMESER